MKYVRYADDTLLGFIGSRAEAEEIREKIAKWLRENLKLTLSIEKTLITNASARFLGYEIVEVHHIRKLADLKEKGRKEKPRWVQKMAQRRRKTLVVCATCHDTIHRGDGKPPSRKASLENGVR